MDWKPETRFFCVSGLSDIQNRISLESVKIDFLIHRLQCATRWQVAFSMLTFPALRYISLFRYFSPFYLAKRQGIFDSTQAFYRPSPFPRGNGFICVMCYNSVCPLFPVCFRNRFFNTWLYPIITSFQSIGFTKRIFIHSFLWYTRLLSLPIESPIEEFVKSPFLFACVSLSRLLPCPPSRVDFSTHDVYFCPPSWLRGLFLQMIQTMQC